jgi:hypothetical protein
MISHHLPLSSLLFSTVPFEDVTAKGEGLTGKVTWTKKKENEKREESKEEKEKKSARDRGKQIKKSRRVKRNEEVI